MKYEGYTAAELLALEAAATPGPWVGDRYDGTVKYAILSGKHHVFNVNCEPPDDISRDTYVTFGDEDTALTMAARNALRPLVEHVQALEARVTELQADLASERRKW